MNVKGFKPGAYVRYAVGRLPHFVPVINGSVTFNCSTVEALEYESLYPADQLATVVQQRDELLAAAKVALEAMESTGMLPASQYKLQAAIAKVQP